MNGTNAVPRFGDRLRELRVERRAAMLVDTTVRSRHGVDAPSGESVRPTLPTFEEAVARAADAP